MLGIQYVTGTDSAAEDSIFLGASDLPGVEESELSSETGNKLEAIVVSGLLQKMFDYVSNNDVLGVAMDKPTLGGVGNNLFDQSYSITMQFYTNLKSGNSGLLPLNGSNFGALNISNVFASLEGVTSGNNPPGNGVLIPYSSFGSLSYVPTASSFDPTDPDNRGFLFGVAQAIFSGLELRGAETTSAITDSTRTTPAGIGAPATVTDDTSLSPSDLPHTVFFDQTISLTTEWEIDVSAGTVQVNAVTT